MKAIFNSTSNYSYFVLLLVAVFFILDIVSDFPKYDIDTWIELVIVFMVVHVIFLILVDRIKIKNELKIQNNAFKKIQGKFADVIDSEFNLLGLSKSEKEVAWLILKGFSFIEISYFRAVKERTIRQQARSIYKKSNTKNRAEFSAFFIEDILTHSWKIPTPI